MALQQQSLAEKSPGSNTTAISEKAGKSLYKGKAEVKQERNFVCLFLELPFYLRKHNGKHKNLRRMKQTTVP